MHKVLLLFFVPVVACKLNAQQNLYDKNTIQKIEITFSDNVWDYRLDTAKIGAGNYIEAKTVVVNGTTFSRCGVKYKGNSSYDSTYKKNPLHIELNTYIEQDYNGTKDIKLSNCYADPSMLREVLSYEMLSNYMDAPRSNIAQVYINGNYIGVYTNNESVGGDFLSDHFYSEEGVKVKCNPLLVPSPAVKSNLKYLGSDSTLYYNYYELESAGGWKALANLCDSINTNANSLSLVLDLDRFLWMLAYNNVFVNLDSYSGAFAQNYYLYQDAHKRFVPIMWDLNMSMGGFPFAGNSNSSLGNLSVSGMQNLSPSLHANDAYWPVIKAVFANAEWKKSYYAHLRTITNEMLGTGTYTTIYNTWYAIADTAVLNDQRKFFSNSNFQTALVSNVSVGSYSVPGIQTLLAARYNYLTALADFTVVAPQLTHTQTQAPAVNANYSATFAIQSANTASICYRFHAADLFTTTLLYDDGQHNDGAANDNLYGVTLPFPANTLQYYVKAENTNAISYLPARAEHEFFTVERYAAPKKNELVINEFLASNKSDVKNEFHSAEDWIEIYNTTFNPLNLDEVYMSDDKNNKCLYRFPNGTFIAPESLLIVWADNFLGGNQYHAGFKLNEAGDMIVLSKGSTNYDKIEFGQQEQDVSMARCTDGLGNFVAMKYPSYARFNCATGVDELAQTNTNVRVFPNPSVGQITLSSEQTLGTIKISDMTGRLVFEETTTTTQIDVALTGLSNGIYIVNCQQQSIKLIISN